MNGLTSGTLAQITRGQLVLGTMPPLGGEWEPVGRIVFDSSQVTRGDVYWERSIGSAPGAADSGLAEEAFARGAVGVVVGDRYVEPWAGAFTIQIADVPQAFHRLAHWVLVRSRRRRLLVVQHQEEILGELLQVVVVKAAAALPLCSSAEQVARETIAGGLQAGWQVISVSAECEEHFARISDLCAPRIAVITSAAAGRMDVPALLESLPARGTAIVAGEADLLAHLQNTSSQVICAGRVNELTLALVTARQLGISGEQITANYQRLLETRAHADSKNCKVPPLVSGLRESDAALPPGLKRRAC